MTRPVVGVIANTHVAENRFPAQIAGERNLRAVAEVDARIEAANVSGVVHP